MNAAELIGGYIAGGSKFTMYVDSQVTLRALMGSFVNTKLVDSCRRALRKLLEKYEVRLCWVAGHRNITGNDMADELARLGLEDTDSQIYNRL